MRENENSTIWDLLIWVTLIGAGTFGLEGLCIHWVKADWMKLILILTGLAGLVWETRTEARGKAAPARSGKLTPSENGDVLLPDRFPAGQYLQSAG